MRTLLNLAHFHGAVLGTSWQLVLATLQVIFPSQKMPYALVFCYNLVVSCSVSSRRSFESSHCAVDCLEISTVAFLLSSVWLEG